MNVHIRKLTEFDQGFTANFSFLYMQECTWKCEREIAWRDMFGVYVFKEALSIRRNQNGYTTSKQMHGQTSRTSARRTRLSSNPAIHIIIYRQHRVAACTQALFPSGPEVLEIHESNPSNLHRGWHHDDSSGHESRLIHWKVWRWLLKSCQDQDHRCQIPLGVSFQGVTNTA